MNRTFSELHTFRISGLDRPGPAASNFRIFAFAILLSFFCNLSRILVAFFEYSTCFLQEGAENPARVHIFLCKLAKKGPDAKETSPLMKFILLSKGDP